MCVCVCVCVCVCARHMELCVFWTDWSSGLWCFVSLALSPRLFADIVGILTLVPCPLHVLYLLYPRHYQIRLCLVEYKVTRTSVPHSLTPTDPLIRISWSGLTPDWTCACTSLAFLYPWYSCIVSRWINEEACMMQAARIMQCFCLLLDGFWAKHSHLAHPRLLGYPRLPTHDNTIPGCNTRDTGVHFVVASAARLDGSVWQLAWRNSLHVLLCHGEHRSCSSYVIGQN